ncbi:MAG: aldo/keto reductase [Spirochaetaceae bacterium]|jgi:aryl-alcohol dehydrogenase-like predicted oxidoreductase|nr:aldo/keto reductase [Spirochaetaceae bacterium]
MIEKINFGKTGHKSSRTIFGAAALSEVTQKEADPVLDILLEYGVNHIDTAASYGGAEDRLKPWLKGHRDKFFLATKTGERSRKPAWDELMRSLERMGVEHIDLWQFHGLISQEDWDMVMGEGGALEAAIEARDKGIISNIGVTGHEYVIPKMHLKSINRFDFDSILLPFNYYMMSDEEYSSDFNELITQCHSRGIAVQTIKSLARSYWSDNEKKGATWYKPITDPEDIKKSVNWVLGHENLFLNTTGDIKLLPLVLEAASNTAGKPEDVVMEEMLKRLKISKIFPFPL